MELLANHYRDGRIGRRAFLERLIALAGGYPLAHQLLETTGWAATPLSQAEAAKMGVAARAVKYPGPGATLEGYLAKPNGSGRFPALIVIHENRGLNEPIREAARRYAQEGFVALAVDPLSRKGGTGAFASPEAAQEVIGTLTNDQIIADLDAAFSYLQSNPSVHPGRIGIAGFGWGGQRALRYTTANSGLKAATCIEGP